MKKRFLRICPRICANKCEFFKAIRFFNIGGKQQKLTGKINVITKNMKEDYTDLIYIISSILAMLVFSVSLFIYLFYKQINIYLVIFGILMLGLGFIMKKQIDKSGNN